MVLFSFLTVLSPPNNRSHIGLLGRFCDRINHSEGKILNTTGQEGGKCCGAPFPAVGSPRISSPGMQESVTINQVAAHWCVHKFHVHFDIMVTIELVCNWTR